MDNISSSKFYNNTETEIQNSLQNKGATTNSAKSNYNIKLQSLTSKKAIELLLEGTLRRKVCRFCLNISSNLTDLDQVFQICNKKGFYKVSLRDMVSSFHPYKITKDSNIPNKICNVCVNKTVSSYRFSQQCEQSERALRNFFEHILEKVEKLDPLEKPKTRGRHKLHPNHNKLFVGHEDVMSYADPLINLRNRNFVHIKVNSEELNRLECLKCCEILPNLASLINHKRKHPTTMWFNCRYCGKSFPKRYQINNHLKYYHISGNKTSVQNFNEFKCKDCGKVSQSCSEHYEHVEKHKFQDVLQHLIERKMDKMCAVCFNKNRKMLELDKQICFHADFPDSESDKTYYSILASTLPNIISSNSYTGMKICEKCTKQALTTYSFINRAQNIRHRLNSCITLMLNSLNQIVEPKNNIFIELSQNVILSLKEQEIVDENLFLKEKDDLDESLIKVDVLEDEFRIESDSETSDSENYIGNEIVPYTINSTVQIDDLFTNLDNPAKNATKTYMKRKFINGYKEEQKEEDIINVCSEFLTFKIKKEVKNHIKITCSVCSKHFVSLYHLEKHVVKHIFKEVKCYRCGLVFKSKFFMFEHFKMVHRFHKAVFSSCKTCGRTFDDENKMKLHLRSHISKRCMLCDKLFISQKHHDVHMVRHLLVSKCKVKEEKQRCSFCKKECANGNKLSLHINKVHLQIKPYSCDMCDRKFYVEYNLKKHKIVHSIKSKELCKVCNKTLKSRKSLVLHIRKHLGVKPFSCKLCNETFISEGRCKQHIKQFHGGYIHCKLCENVYSSQSDLSKHVNLVHNVF